MKKILLLIPAISMVLTGYFDAAAETTSLAANDSIAVTQKSENSSSSAQQNSTALSPEISKKIDEFYKTWEQNIKTMNHNDFVNYYSLIREKPDGEKNDSLLIYLDGSGYKSVMGVKNGDNWIVPGNAYGLAKTFPDYDFLTIDKANIKMGGYHSSDPAVINNYSFDNRVNNDAAVIDEFLKDKNYKQIFLYGASEGGQILPRVYNILKHKDKITKLVVEAAGGLSQYEEFKILGKSNLLMEPGYKEMYSQVEETYKDITENPGSTDKQYGGLTYKRWYGFMKYNPMEDYIKIDIPILIQHGAKDTNSPVETARAVETEFKKLGKSNLKYIEYADMGHGPENKEQNNMLFGNMNNWLKGNAL